MIKKFSIRFSSHPNGMATKAEFPLSGVVGNIVGVAAVLRRANTETERRNGINYLGYADMMEQVNKNNALRLLGKVTFSTDEGESFASCLLSGFRSSLNKRMVSVDYKKPISRMCVTIEENDFIDPDDYGQSNEARVAYDVDVYLKTRR